MIMFAIGDILGISATVTHKALLLPGWAWFTIGTIALFVSQFLAFHKVRTERDKAKAQLANKEMATVKVKLDSRQLLILNELKEKLVEGIPYNEIRIGDREVLIQLDLQGIVHQVQRRQSSGPHQYDLSYWVLTEEGKAFLTGRLSGDTKTS